NRAYAVRHERARIGSTELVLRRARERELTRHGPWSLSAVKRRARKFSDVLGDAPPTAILEVRDPRQLVRIDAIGIVNEAAGVGRRHDRRTELVELLDRVECDIA